MYFIYDVLVKRQAVVKVDSFHMFAKLYDITKCQQNRIIWCYQTVFIAMMIFFTTHIWFKNERIQLLTVSLLQSGKKRFVYKNVPSLSVTGVNAGFFRQVYFKSPVQSYRSLHSFWIDQIYSTNDLGINGGCLIRPTFRTVFSF